MPPILRRIHALLVWLAAGALAALFLADAIAPAAALRFADAAAPALLGSLQLGALLLGLAVLFWPPTLPWLRRGWRQLKQRSAVDRAPMLQAMQDLELLETPDKQLTIGRTLWQLGEGRKAVPHLTRAVELDPDMVGARYLLGRVLRESGAAGQAAAVLGQVVAREPDHGFGGARRELARALVECGQGEPALQQLDANDQTHGPSPFSGYWRGRAWQALGNRAAAREAFRQVAAWRPEEGAPRDPDAGYWQALARVAALFGAPARGQAAKEVRP